MIDPDTIRKMKNQKVIYFTIIIICLLGSLVSIFFPYLEKLDMLRGDLDLLDSVPGYKLIMPRFILIFMFLTVFAKNETRAFIYSFIILCFVYYTRTAIHYQGFLDHDYHSKTGIVYYILFVFSIIFFLATTINWIRMFWLKRKAAPNSA